MDWIATWLIDSHKSLKGVGKALLSQAFKLFENTPFTSMFVRFDLSKNSPTAIKFYEKMGFNPVLPMAEAHWQSADRPIEFFNMNKTNFDECSILPMEIGKNTALEKVRAVLDKYHGKTLLDKPVTPESIIDFKM